MIAYFAFSQIQLLGEHLQKPLIHFMRAKLLIILPSTLAASLLPTIFNYKKDVYKYVFTSIRKYIVPQCKRIVSIFTLT